MLRTRFNPTRYANAPSSYIIWRIYQGLECTQCALLHSVFVVPRNQKSQQSPRKEYKESAALADLRRVDQKTATDAVLTLPNSIDIPAREIALVARLLHLTGTAKSDRVRQLASFAVKDKLEAELIVLARSSTVLEGLLRTDEVGGLGVDPVVAPW